MNDAEYADRAEDGVISGGQNDTSSWEAIYGTDIIWRDAVAVNPTSDAQDSVDHYRMHLRHYQEEVRDLKSEVESLKNQLKGSQDQVIKGALKHLSFNATRIYPTIEEVLERQARHEIDPLVKNQCFADAVKNPFNAGPHKYSSGDKLWATAHGGDAVYGLETEVRVRVWDGDVPTTDTVDHKGVWLDSAANGELARVQIISVKDQHNES